MNRWGRSFANESRCRIVALLLEGPAYSSEIATALGLPRANVSNHLNYLLGERMIDRTAEGRRVQYRISAQTNLDVLQGILALFDEMESGNTTG